MENNCSAIKALHNGWKPVGNDKYIGNHVVCPKCGSELIIYEKSNMGKECCVVCDYASSPLPSKANFCKRQNSSINNWSKRIKRRDAYTCVMCHANEDVEAHHIYPVKDFPEYRLEYWNGITLCKNCHKMIHEKIRSVYEKESVAYRTGQSN